MKNWKLQNTCMNQVRLAVTIGPAQSKGIVLKPGEIVICNSQRTPSMDAQIRRRFIELDSDFDNSSLGLELGRVYTSEEFDAKKIETASRDANQYIEKK